MDFPANLTIRSSLRNIHILPHRRSSSTGQQGTLQGTLGLSFVVRRPAVEGLADTAWAVRDRGQRSCSTGGRGLGLGVMRGCSEHLPEDPGCSIVVGHIAVADNLGGGSCHGPCQPPLPHTTIPPTRAIRAITRMSRRGRLNGSAPLWGVLRPLIVIAKTKISHSPFRESLWRLQLTLGPTLRQLCRCV
jgi:hypothetical protein